MSNVFIGRQPILNRNMEIFAYELQFYQGLNPNKESVKATAELIDKTQEDIGFSAIVGKHVAMMQLPKELIKKDFLPEFDEGQQVVLEIPNNVEKDIEVLKNLKELKNSGSSIALNNYIDDGASIKLASISDFVKVDIENNTEIKLKKIVEDLHAKKIKVIADKVETEEMFNYLKKLGFDFFQGYFFTNPLIINGKKLSGNKLTLLQLMAKVNDPETDFHELSAIIGQDVALSHKLLVAVNNPVAMIPIQVESVADALKYMGLKRLKFWVNMLALSSMDDVPQELLITSLMRANFCGKLAEKAGHIHDKDTYFLVGLFSNLGAFFRSPIEDILKEMPLSEEICDALIDKKGPMGEALKCLIELEKFNVSVEDLKYEGLNISEIGNIFMESSAWAQQVMQEG